MTRSIGDLAVVRDLLVPRSVRHRAPLVSGLLATPSAVLPRSSSAFPIPPLHPPARESLSPSSASVGGTRDLTNPGAGCGIPLQARASRCRVMHPVPAPPRARITQIRAISSVARDGNGTAGRLLFGYAGKLRLPSALPGTLPRAPGSASAPPDDRCASYRA
jgi:hypothetical protein